MKKIIAFLLVLVLVLGSVANVAAADKKSKKATTIRLSQTEGSVTVKNAVGVKQDIKAGGKLLNGYTVTTGADGLAYLSLDDKRIVKLDIRTTVKVKKTGKKIQVFLESGSIFCDVQNKLAADEQLTIKTTNTTTGVRGTTFEVVAGVRNAALEDEIKNGASRTPKQLYTEVRLVDGSLNIANSKSGEVNNITAGESLSCSSQQNTTQTNITSFKPAELKPSTLCELMTEQMQETLKKLPNYDQYQEAGKDAEEKMQEQIIESKKVEEEEQKSAKEETKQEVQPEFDNPVANDEPYMPDPAPAPQTYTVTLALTGGAVTPGSDISGWNIGVDYNLGPVVLTRSALSGEVISLPDATKITSPNKSAQNNSMLVGWCTDAQATGTTYSSITVSGDITLYPMYRDFYQVILNIVKLSGAGTNQWCPTGWTDNGTNTYSKTFLVQSGITQSLDDGPAYPLYMFEGWYNNLDLQGTSVSAITISSSNDVRTFYAKYTSNTNNVVYLKTTDFPGYNPGGIWTADGSGNYYVSVASGSAVTLPTEGPSNPGKKFLGWKLYGQVVPAGYNATEYYSSVVASEETIQFSPEYGQLTNPIKVTLGLNGGTYTQAPAGWTYDAQAGQIYCNAEKGSTLQLPTEEPIYTSGTHVFTGWKNNQQQQQTITSITVPDQDSYVGYAAYNYVSQPPSNN